MAEDKGEFILYVVRTYYDGSENAVEEPSKDRALLENHCFGESIDPSITLRELIGIDKDKKEHRLRLYERKNA